MVDPYRNVLNLCFCYIPGGCIDETCCFDTCCSKKFEMSDIDFYTPVIIIFVMMASTACLFVICLACAKKFLESRELQPQEPTRNQHIPPPPPALPVPSVPPLIQSSDPPPYSEVVDKPYFYPAPVGQPPCYDNIAMEDLSRELSLHDQCSRIISERSSVSAAITLGH